MTNYRLLEIEEIPARAAELDAAWKDESIPRIQWESTTRAEVQKFRDGIHQPHFDALIRCLRTIPQTGTLLEIGASSGYYSEVLRLAGFTYEYRGSDFSEAYQRLARELWPNIKFDIADARSLPYTDEEFDIVLSGANLMHIYEYPKAIAEAARVSKSFVIFHRTPIFTDKPTNYGVKNAYGVECIEMVFNEAELLGLFTANGLIVVHTENIFFDSQAHYGHRTYLLKK